MLWPRAINENPSACDTTLPQLFNVRLLGNPHGYTWLTDKANNSHWMRRSAGYLFQAASLTYSRSVACHSAISGGKLSGVWHRSVLGHTHCRKRPLHGS
jgi:hypothetical protein